MKREELGAQAEGAQVHPMERLVSAEELLKLLFEEQSRPSLHWLRNQQKARNVPYIKIGRLVFFKPSEVQRFLDERLTVTVRRK